MAPFFLVAALLLVVPASPASAAPAVELRVDLGWDGQIRPDRWNVARVRATAPRADGRATDAVFEWYVPRPGRQAMVLRQPAVLNPSPASFLALLPIGPNIEALHLHVTDAKTGQTLGWWPAEPPAPESYADRQVIAEGASAQPFVGVTGEGPELGFLRPEAVVAYLPAIFLPNQPVGYDALDVLALNRVDWSATTFAQQQAWANWVRAGGELWVWMGTEPLPPQAPITALLAEALPGLPLDREARPLAEGAEPVFYTPLANVGDAPLLTAGEAGLGRVIFLHADPSDWPEAEQSQLVPTLRPSISPYISPAAFPTLPPNVSSWTDDIPLVWLGLAMLIGPIDWLVLRLSALRAGRLRRGRSWYTLPGWVALILLMVLSVPPRVSDVVQREVAVAEAEGQRVAARAIVALPRDPVPVDDDTLGINGPTWWKLLDTNRTEGPYRDVPVTLTPTGIQADAVAAVIIDALAVPPNEPPATPAAN